MPCASSGLPTASPLCENCMLHTVGRLAGVPCLRKVLCRCRSDSAAVLSTPASGMSKQLEKTDFGPDGFKWLTLKRIVVSGHGADLLDPKLSLRVLLMHAHHPSFCRLQYQDPSGRCVDNHP